MVKNVAGPVKSTVDYIMVRQEDKAKIRNVKVITVAKVSATSLILLTSVISILLYIINVYLYSMRPEERREERREEWARLPPSPRIYKRSGVQRGDI